MVTRRFEIKTPANILYGRVINYIGNFFFVACVIIASALLLFSSVTIECEVVGKSMVPTFNANSHSQGDIVYVNKYLTDYNYGDIVVIDVGENDPIIKRVIGVAGDVIDVVYNQFVGYKIEINGKIIEEYYINYDGNVANLSLQNGIGETFNKFHGHLKETRPELFVDGKLVVPDGEIFVLGDNRHDSRDSSYYGTFKTSQLMGTVERYRNSGESEFMFYFNFIIKGEFFDTIFNCF